ncbi:MAG TPA: pilus assembly protein TadG-related protein [Solirubrobacteraceae bacterium]|nr:pilus assembly protein TadG-related protein [Solirubrobacteraceae bacterium]
MLPLVALALVVLLGCAAFAVDLGNAYLHKRRLQAAVDLAALSAAQDLPAASQAIREGGSFARTNWSTRDSSSIDATVTTGCYTPDCQAPDKVTVSATADVSTGFARVFGIDDIHVHAKAAACGPCETSVQKFDVMVVLDRSYSMCTNSSGGPYPDGKCDDLLSAEDGIRSLLGFFNPATDRVGLALLSSADDHAPFDHTGAAAPCDGASHAVSGGLFAGSRGDFMDGTPTDHDSWVVTPLDDTFKDPGGPMQRILDPGCLQAKLWTPIAPAIQQAAQVLETQGRQEADVRRVIVFFGDGGANVQPMQRDGHGNSMSAFSWYRPLVGTPTNILPCEDAVAQAAAAKAAGIEVYVFGYDLNASGAQSCYKNNTYGSAEGDPAVVNATSTLKQMASGPDQFFAAATPEEVTDTFNRIGHQITSGGTRLVE